MARVEQDMLTNDEVLKLEAEVAALTDRLTAIRDVKGAPGEWNRDLRGTLHVNLCALSRAADRAATALEREFGFRRG